MLLFLQAQLHSIGQLRIIADTVSIAEILYQLQFKNYGVLTHTVGTLTNDFFVNLLDMNIEWKQIDEHRYLFKGFNRKTKEPEFKATRVDLIFAHHDELRAVVEVYASDDAKKKFVSDFIKAY